LTSPLYVIFTSGSTGKPKGVITSHLSLMTYIDAVARVLSIDDTDILGNQSPLDYIAAIRDIYLPISYGASTVIIPKNEFAIPTALVDTLNREKITALCWSVAGVELPAKLGAFDESKPQYLKKLCFSGSVISSKYLRIWQENLPDVLYVNQYGPTEATASCTYYVVPGTVSDDTVLPIGKPYDNYRVFLLNDDDAPTPDGEIGQICVTGPIVALGYYGNAEMTEKSFVQNPLNPNFREIIYKTGDLGHFAPDGNLMFHGRMDRQIKHLGHRIELGEIEETAKLIEGVTDCCALYQKERETLYLFYTGPASSKEIVLHFRSSMPAFMVPRKLINLDELPRLPNGKIDMQTLKTYFK
jgi:acyl-coenzyme A synthetase/AMP-(fatty) acid ligase